MWQPVLEGRRVTKRYGTRVDAPHSSHDVSHRGVEHMVLRVGQPRP